MTTRLTVLSLADEHVEMLAEFFRTVWNPSASADAVRGARLRSAEGNHAEPGRPLPAAVAVRGNAIIGYCGTLPVRFWDGSREHAGYWAKGLMVLPEFQNGPLGFMLLKEVTKGAALIGALTVNPASKRLFGALGYREVGPLPNRIKPVRLAGIARNLDLGKMPPSRVPRGGAWAFGLLQQSGLAVGVGLLLDQVARLAMPTVDANLKVSVIGRVSEREIDALWLASASDLAAATVRDGSAFLTRYGDGESDPDYRVVAVRRGGGLAAVAAIRNPRVDGDPRLAGVRVASLSDLLVRPVDRAACLALLAGVEDCARAIGADAVWCSASSGRLIPLLRRRGYIKLASNVSFFIKAPKDSPQAWSLPVDAWWIARGDAESDESF